MHMPCFAPSWFYQVSSSTPPNHHHHPSWRSCRPPWQAALPPTRHSSFLALTTLPEELLLARFVLVRRDTVQSPLAPLYDKTFCVLQRSTLFFLQQIGD
jgi:hypothetical protein